MRIFLSYPAGRRDLAVRLKLALEAEQHDVFYDRDDLTAGEAYHQRIREAIAAADLFIYFVAPESVAPGSYTLAELDLAQRAWPRPAGRVLPLMVAPTPLASLPPYLLAVTLLQPQGEVVAETVAAVGRLRRGPRWGRWALGVGIGLLLLAVAGAGYRWWRMRKVDLDAQAATAQVLKNECLADPAAATPPRPVFEPALQRMTQPNATPAFKRAVEDCAMLRVRKAHITIGQGTFAGLVAPLRPPLEQGLADGAQGQRAADLRAHLGWADYLAWRDQHASEVDPADNFRQALKDDPDNVYAHAMWAHWLLVRGPAQVEEALRHFEAASRDGRDPETVLALEVGAMVSRENLAPHLLRLLDALRRRPGGPGHAPQ